MSQTDPFDVIARHRAAGRPFAVATVVRSSGASSAKSGAKAVVTEDGAVIGYGGGGCIRAAIVDSAVTAMRTGEAQLVRVSAARAEPAEGPSHYPNGCPSEGTVDLFVEPWIPPLTLAIIGGSAVGRAVCDLGKAMGFRVVPTAAGADLPPLQDRDAVVVATQGDGDRAALEAALLSGAGYVAMVASRKKAAALREALCATSICPKRVAALRAPAGLDLGGHAPADIALSIVAEIVQIRNRQARA